ncbi:MAG: hypothetical protein ACUVTN_12100 [Thermodesulfobacteriota bacterium]
MKKLVIISVILVCFVPILLSAQIPATKLKTPSLSQETSACLECHKQFTPGIVEDWLRGWWNLTENLQQMKDWVELMKRAKAR